jgi:glucokinase
MITNKAKPGEGIVVFDIGGTFFRSGIYTKENRLISIKQQPSLSFISRPNKQIKELKQGLTHYLINTTRCYAKQTKIRQVAISLGAPLDSQRGVIYGSGPLWGQDCALFDLQTQLSEAAPEFTWHIVNDVTAGLVHYAAHTPQQGIRKILFVTISSGVACRLLDARTRHIPLDEFGLQGEIGHLPVTLNFEGHTLELQCDCGGRNHLAAFASGRGIAKLFALLAQHKPLLWQKSRLAALHAQGIEHNAALRQALKENDPFARTLLLLATQPIANILRDALTLDPEIDRVVLTGGVAINLAESYRAALIQHLSEHGLYLRSAFDPKLFDRCLVIANTDEANNLKGAALSIKTHIGQGSHV